MERREFLRGLAGTVLATEGFKTEAKLLGEGNTAYVQVLARTVMDTERLVYGAAGLEMTFEQQLEIYRKATEAVEEGLDPYDKDFWKKLVENNPDPSNYTLVKFAQLKEKRLA